MHTKAALTLFGGILIHLTLGTLYTSSNLATYVISYCHVVKHQENIDSTLSPWIFALQSLGQAMCMLVGGILQHFLGVKLAIFIGSLCVSLSTILGYWTINNYYLLCATYGLIFGIGIGIAYSSPMTAAMKWFPNHRGLANGLIVFGFGFGSLIFNFVQTFYINPNNVNPIPDPTGAASDYYFPAEVASRTPNVFLILGTCYFAMQLLGLLFISEPDENEQKELAAESHQPLLPKTDGESGMDVRSSLKKWKFWEIWVTMLCVSMTNVFVSSFYKFFGQTIIKDDTFLSLVGSISSVCNGVCRPFWGWLNDKIGYKKTMSMMLALFITFICTFSLTQYGKQAMFMVWVCVLYFCIGGAFAILPTHTDSCFGHRYFGTLYGFVFTAVIISSILSAFFVTTMVKKIGVLGITIALGVFMLLAFLITLCAKNWKYTDDLQPLQEVATDKPQDNPGDKPAETGAEKPAETGETGETAQKQAEEKTTEEVGKTTEEVEKPTEEKPAEEAEKPAEEAEKPAEEAEKKAEDAETKAAGNA